MRATLGLVAWSAACAPGTAPTPPKAAERLELNELLADPPLDERDVDACERRLGWFEVYNPSAAAISLRGWSARAGDAEWPLPDEVVEPFGFWVGDAERVSPGAAGALPLPLAGGSLAMVGPDGAVSDEVTWEALTPWSSWGREVESAPRWVTQPDPSPGAANVVASQHPCLLPDPVFDDHAARCVPTLQDFNNLAGVRPGIRTVKFNVAAFDDPAARTTVFLDAKFYHAHHEWYLFRLLNGVSVPGDDEVTPFDGAFRTVEEMVDWAREVDLAALLGPGVAEWSEGGLYSPRFTDLSWRVAPRRIGPGVVLRVDARAGQPELWAFELEYGDVPTEDDLLVFFAELSALLPAEVGPRLRWLVRSPEQEAVAEALDTAGRPVPVLRYEDLVVEGESVVYNAGATAGRVRFLEPGASTSDTTADDVVVLGQVPDVLPQAAALVTGVPQTPLSHVSMLAASRGIPNVYVANIGDDALWKAWADGGTWIALEASVDGGVRSVALTDSDVAVWRSLRAPRVLTLPPVDAAGLPNIVAVDTLAVEALDAWTPAIGGKSAGMVFLRDWAEMATPDAPMAITVRPFLEHMERLGLVAPTLAQPAFSAAGTWSAREVLLEGADAFLRRHPELRPVADGLLVEHPAGSALGEMIRGGGLRGAIEAQPIDPTTLAELTATLTATYGFLSPSQGLRFRSSSTVEDAEGFTGAGLYESETGFLDPERAGHAGDTVERAILKVWGSFWSAEAYAERLAAGFSADAGLMGVLVHPRFDDPLERANVVAVVTAHNRGDFSVVVNAQPGARSVANPEGGTACEPVQPEVVRLTGRGDGLAVIERLAGSSLVGPGEVVLEDPELWDLFDGLASLSDVWRDVVGRSLPASQRPTSLTLDAEVKWVDAGWPALADGSVRPAGLVIKQARTVGVPLARVPSDLLALPVPRDVLARAAMVREVVCEASALRLSALEVFTDPLLTPDLGWASVPFTASVALEVLEDRPEVGWALGATWTVEHPAFEDVVMVPSGDGFVLDVRLETSESATTGRLWMDEGGWWRWTSRGGTTIEGPLGRCEVEVVWSSPEAWVASVLDRR